MWQHLFLTQLNDKKCGRTFITVDLFLWRFGNECASLP